MPGAANPQAFNRYSYVLNSPINFDDPTGHATCIDGEYCGKARSYNQRNIYKEKHKDNKGGGDDYFARVPAVATPAVPVTPTTSGSGKSSYAPLGILADPPPPADQRLAIGMVVAPFFLVMDVTLWIVTVQMSKATLLAPEPISKAIMIVGDIVIGGVDILVAYANVSMAHWVRTGEQLTKDNWTDWEQRP